MTVIGLFKAELRAVFTNPALLLTVFGGVLFYSFLYPLPYISQVPREQQVVVADLDNSQFSRRMTRMVDATPQVRVVRQAATIAEAKDLFVRDKLAGMLVIPENFYRDLLLGARPSLSFAGDASYFLVFGTVLEGMSGAGQTLAAQVKVNRMLMSGQAMQLAEEQYTPVKLRLHALFNEAEGYVNYVIPAVFILILHQTLIMGIGILCGTENERLPQQRADGVRPYWLEVSPFALAFVRGVVFFGIYTLLSLYYFGSCLMIYDLPRLGSYYDIFFFGVLFLFSATFLGMALGALLKRRELATLLVLFSSMPLIFSCGFIWPEAAIPHFISILVQLVPVVPAIKGFVLINQMGASLQQVLPQIIQLSVLGLFNYALAVLLLARRKREVGRIYEDISV